MNKIRINNVEIQVFDLFGVPVVNTTPHEIRFREDSGNEVVIPPSGFVVNASPKERVISTRNGVVFVRTEFQKDPETEKIIDEIIEKVPNVVIVGSIIAAQAYPGKVVAMTPAPGYERVKPKEKRMNPKKFTTFI